MLWLSMDVLPIECTWERLAKSPADWLIIQYMEEPSSVVKMFIFPGSTVISGKSFYHSGPQFNLLD